MQNPHNRHGPGPREMTLDSIRTARRFCRSDRHDPRLDQLSARLPHVCAPPSNGCFDRLLLGLESRRGHF